MTRLIIGFLLFSCMLSAQDIGGDYYVATDGDDEAAGTYAAPWATWIKAFTEAVAGDTVYFMGGTYYTPGNHAVVNSGTVNNRICFFGYPGDTVIMDCSLHDQAYNGAIYILRKEYLHFKNFTVRNVFQDDESTTGAINNAEGANQIFEDITVHNISTGRGIWYSSGAWNETDSARAVDVYGASPADASSPFDYDTAYFINCDVYNICDSASASPGNAGDAWKTEIYEPGVMYFDSCRAWFYSDDGYDCSNISNGKYRFNNCWAMATNKYLAYLGSMEGDGWKMGGSFSEHGNQGVHMIHCLAMFCGGDGFREQEYETAYRTNGRYYNNTSYKNGIGFLGMGNECLYPRTTRYRNNIVYGSTKTVDGYGVPFEISLWYCSYIESNNTWDRTAGTPNFIMTDTVTVTGADFVTDDSTTLVAHFIAPRSVSGTLPSPKPLVLASTSDLIDAGTQVYTSDAVDDLAFDGLAPDIGYYEHEADLVLSDSVNIFATGGATTIPAENGTLQMIDTVWPLNVSFPDVTWSTHTGTGSGTITPDGLVQAVSDGTDTIRGTAQDGTGNYDDYILTYSNQDAFTVPTIITAAISNTHSVQATCGGNATATGGAAITAKGICWNTSTNPTTANSFTVDGTGTGAFTSAMTNLNNSTLYYVRAYATNSEGTAYGDNRQVTTSAYSTIKGAGDAYRHNSQTVVF